MAHWQTQRLQNLLQGQDCIAARHVDRHRGRAHYGTTNTVPNPDAAAMGNPIRLFQQGGRRLFTDRVCWMTNVQAQLDRPGNDIDRAGAHGELCL